MNTLNNIIGVLKGIVVSGLAVRFVIICIKLIFGSEDEKSQNIKRLKHCIIAAVLVVTIVMFKDLIQSYYR